MTEYYSSSRNPPKLYKMEVVFCILVIFQLTIVNILFATTPPLDNPGYATTCTNETTDTRSDSRY